MNWDIWPVIVLAMTLAVSVRPGRATMVLSEGTTPASTGRCSLAQAGGGVAMLTMAIYLLVQCRDTTGFGYWDMPLLALQSPDMRGVPSAWVPAVCWLCLAGLGSWWLFAGARATRTPRDLTGLIYALNEIAIFGSLLSWGVTVPETWTQAVLFGFALRGVYVSYLAGAAVRLMLALSSFAFPPAQPPSAGRRHRVNSSLRRY